jgi:hypothetical protein
MLLTRCLYLDLLTADASGGLLASLLPLDLRSVDSCEKDAFTYSERIVLVFEY